MPHRNHVSIKLVCLALAASACAIGNADEPPSLQEMLASAQAEQAAAPSPDQPGPDTTSPPAGATPDDAMYAGEEGGGTPPYGAGHGGNSGGMTDAEGRYSDTWQVSATAPSGPARVDVVVGADGEFGSTIVPFEVADPVTRRCN